MSAKKNVFIIGATIRADIINPDFFQTGKDIYLHSTHSSKHERIYLFIIKILMPQVKDYDHRIP
jgi:hypothetical protein